MFKNRLSKLIKERKMTQTELAKALGTHRQNVYQWVAGKTRPRPQDFKKLAQYFGVTVDYLLSETEEDEMVIINTGNLAAHNSKISVGETLSPQETEVIRIYRSLSPKEQARFLLDLYKKEEEG